MPQSSLIRVVTSLCFNKIILSTLLIIDCQEAKDNYRENCGASLVAQRLKRLPLIRETWVRSLGQEDPLEKEMATHSSILAWRIPWMEEPGGLQSMGSQRVGHD